MKRIDILEASKLLAKEKVPVNDVTLMLGSQYAEGWRTGDIRMAFKEWLDEDVEDADVEEVADESDPTEPPVEVGTPELNTTKWPSSAISSPDSVPLPSGT